MLKEKKIYPAYISKHNSNREKQIIHLKIPNRELLLLFIINRTASKNNGDLYCLNCFNSISTKNKLESHKGVCENKDICNVTIPFESTKILEFDQYHKFDKAPFIICADLECIIEKIDTRGIQR